MAKAKDVDEYIANAAKEAIPILREIREIIRSTIPKAEEGISWNVPFYKYYGSMVGFAAFRNHVNLGIATGVLETKDRELLEKKGYKTGIKTLQIRFAQKVPVAIIKNILKEKAKMNETKKSPKPKA